MDSKKTELRFEISVGYKSEVKISDINPCRRANIMF